MTRAPPAEDEHALTRAFLDHGRTTGWAAAPRYLLRSLPTHADRAGLVDELLTEARQWRQRPDGADLEPRRRPDCPWIHVHHPIYAIEHVDHVLVVGLSAGLL